MGGPQNHIVRRRVQKTVQRELVLMTYVFAPRMVCTVCGAIGADARNLISLTFLWPPFAYKLLGFEYLSLAHVAGDAVEIVYRGFVTLRCRQAKPQICADVILCDALPLSVQSAEVVLRPGMALPGSELPPLCRFDIVLCQALAVSVPIAKVFSGASITLIRGKAVPFHGLNVVLRNAQALGVHVAKISLGTSATSIGGQAKPFQRLAVVARYAAAFKVVVPEFILRPSMALV